MLLKKHIPYQIQGKNVLNRHKALLNFLFLEVPCPEGFNKTKGANKYVPNKKVSIVSSIQECGEKLKEYGLLFLSYLTYR